MDDQDEYRFEIFDTVTCNMVGWAATLDEAKAQVESWRVDPTGLVVLTEHEVVFRYHGPLVAP